MMTHQTIGLAGSAEAALSIALLVAWFALCFIAVLALQGFVRRSWKIALSAFILLLIFTGLYMPWTVFAPIDDSEDSDVTYWVSEYRVMAGFWIICVISSLTLFALVIRSRRYRMQRQDDDARGAGEHRGWSSMKDSREYTRKGDLDSSYQHWRFFR